MPAHYIWLIPALPLVGVLINGFFGHRLPGKWAGWLASLLVLGSFLVAYFVMQPVVAQATAAGQIGYRDFTLYQWITQDPDMVHRGPALSVPVAVRADPLSLTMVLVVTGVGFLIHLYSVGYMEHEERFARYFTFLNLFTFAMLILVMANNYLLMFVGWEGVGLCSYLLIGFWFEKESAAAAGKKAFLVNRVGDFGFILGVIMIFVTFGTLTYSTPNGQGVFDKVQENLDGRFNTGVPALMWITLLLFVGAMGKSAQGPLYLWLPDAMEGPTPVSALIHAATMVTAGVYMVARSAALYSRAPASQWVVAWVGILTALFAAIVAIYQYDIKRVLAYSTVSQLGYMFVGVGVGAYATGIFHLVTHAFFKALLFLGAGSVMHALAGELDMRKMGGLSTIMKVTCWTFAIGWLAIDGIFPFAGFYSKDAILHAAMGRFPIVAWIGVFAAGLTAFYMSRLFFTTFLGESRYQPEAAAADAHGGSHPHPAQPSVEPTAVDHDHAHGHGGHGAPHESPPVMTVPLIILAILSAVGGIWLSGTKNLWVTEQLRLGEFLEPSLQWVRGAEGAVEHAGAISGTMMALISLGVAVLGIAIALFLYFLPGVFARGWNERNAWVRAADARFGYDGAMHAIFVRGGWTFSEMLWAMVDELGIDGAVDGIGKLTAGLAQGLRQLQTGFVRNYALVVLTGVVFVIISLMVNWRGH
jgi:NADH-quinone oxidoreductase subunit L